MAFNGTRLFRYALLFEGAANTIAVIPAIFSPETALSYLVTGPNQITPATRTLMQWFGALILTGFTVPLALCYPNPVPSQGGTSQIVAWRRLVYIMFGVGEAGLGTAMLLQYAKGDSGLTDNALLFGVANMGAFLAVRAFFLYVRPSFMEAQGNVRKAQ